MRCVMLLLAVLIAGCSAPPPPAVRPILGAPSSSDCLASAGYTWCEATQGCMRQWETPCPDNYNSCMECIQKQRSGVNIACPAQCDIDVLTDHSDPCICPPAPPCPLIRAPQNGCTISRPAIDECGCTSGCPFFTCPSGSPCGGFAAALFECEAGLECVAPRMLHVADMQGRCEPLCASTRDARGNCIPEECTAWFDGCNLCIQQPGGTCTTKDCPEPPGIPKCVDGHIFH